MAAEGFTSIDYFITNSFLGKPVNKEYPGLFKSSRFEVLFLLPSKVFSGRNGSTSAVTVSKFLSDNVESIDVPGFDMPSATSPFRHSLKQRVEEGQVSVTFFEDAIMSIRNSMWEWIDFISETRGDLENITRNYFGDIIAPLVSIYPLTLDGKRAFRHIELIDVFPTSVPPQLLNIASESEVVKTSVTFKYRFQKIVNNNSFQNSVG